MKKKQEVIPQVKFLVFFIVWQFAPANVFPPFDPGAATQNSS
jgi:hypothetical protein